uniref:Uncharacterized protein n=1 Tax=Salarias fasciatus TaxID=181472 RepID=A0A672HQX5_SALFA
MDLNEGQCMSSAGYRLQERTNMSKLRTGPTAERTQHDCVQTADRSDPVKQERVWREVVYRERRGAMEWERNWGFLRCCDQMGQPQSKQPPPTHVSPFSDRIPNTANQVYGSRLSTPLAAQLIRLDRLLMGQGSHRRCNPDPEMLPC